MLGQAKTCIKGFMVRPPLFRAIAACAVLASASTSHASEALERTYAERMALLAVDGRCALFNPPMRHALRAGANQARGALLRSGWTNARADALSARAHSLMADRPCADPTVITAVRSAEAGFSGYRRLAQMAFPGTERTWQARRRSDADGWLVVQADGDNRFGLRLGEAGPEAAFMLPLDPKAPVPMAARLLLRDARRAPTSPLDIPGRRVGQLSDNTPHPAMAKVLLANGRSTAAASDASGRRIARFTFPEAALAEIAALDPREAVVIELEGPNGVQRRLVEVGDLGAALAFVRIS